MHPTEARPAVRTLDIVLKPSMMSQCSFKPVGKLSALANLGGTLADNLLSQASWTRCSGNAGELHLPFLPRAARTKAYGFNAALCGAGSAKRGQLRETFLPPETRGSKSSPMQKARKPLSVSASLTPAFHSPTLALAEVAHSPLGQDQKLVEPFSCIYGNTTRCLEHFLLWWANSLRIPASEEECLLHFEAVQFFWLLGLWGTTGR